ncbi:MAG: MFS transporter [Acutalibacteraceae bacterium]|nr:MFS transporter [Acutalibacteraceae bacterium]
MEKLKYGYNKEQYKKFTFNSWKYLLLFSLLYCTHYCTRLNFGNAQVEMSLSEAQIGIITSTLFWTYGIGHLVNGRLGEIFGIRRFIILSVFLSAVTNIIMGFQSSFIIMVILWGLNGYFQSMAWSPGIASLTAWWPGDKRGFATGFANAFSGFGQVLASLMVALAFTVFNNNWRWAFFLPAFVPLLMLVVYMIFAKSGPKSVGLEDYKEDDGEKAEKENEMSEISKSKGALFPYIHLFTNKTFLVWMFVVFASGVARYGLVTWIPKYFKEEMGLTSVASLLSSTILPIGMGIGTLLVPALTDKFCPNNRLLASVVSGIAAGVCIMGFSLLQPTGFQFVLMMILLFLAGFFIYAINGIVWAYAADVGGRVFASTASGILDFAAYMGAAIQSMVYGFILGDGKWNVLFISVAVFCVVISIVSIMASFKKKKA